MRAHAKRNALSAIALLAIVLAGGCERRDSGRIIGGIPRTGDVRQIELQPGQPIASPAMTNPYEGNPTALAEGKRLYHWYNCGGCHFNGGGGIGPPLMDDDWIYGSEPQNILASILEGRPEGMPSYRGKIPQEHALKIVAYVSTLSQQDPEVGRRPATDDTLKKRMEELEKNRETLGRPLPPQEQE